MAGHSHWAGIKHKKKLVDAKRGKLFSKLAKNIMSAARVGGKNPDANLELSYAIQRAKDANMTKESIERAILKGSGELPGEALETVIYEGYACNGVAVMIQVLTDNKNRTVSEIRNVLERHGGSLAGPGSVAWMFERKGMIVVPYEGTDEEDLMLTALDAGADDVVQSGSIYEIYCIPESLKAVRETLEGAGFTVESGDISQIPSSSIKVDDANAGKILSLMNQLEEHDDVQNLYANFEISEELIEQYA
jgi:YebC/PmpR family DNA-binding regulatory protein